jgi:hypothetical protein
MKLSDNKIVKLYESGLSAKQISDYLDLSCFKVRRSLKLQSIPMRSQSNASRMLHITKFGKKPYCLKSQLTQEEDHLRPAGIMLYWGEGTKSGNSVVFSNSDPQMIKLFLKFLRNICGVDNSRLRILLHLYHDQNEKQLKNFWSKITGISINQFSKSYIHIAKGGNYKKISEYGTVSLRYSDKELLNMLNNWIDGYRMPK